LELKFVPFTVREKLGPPTRAEVGDRLDTVGTFCTVPIMKLRALDDPPLPGFCTVTLATPALVKSPGVTVAVNWLELLKLVIRKLPFQRTTAPSWKPEPFTVRVKPLLPGSTPEGLSEVIVGPLLVPIVNGKLLEIWPLVVTVTCTVAAVVMRLAGTVAVNCVELT
jgi:hypothetical protein